MTKSSCRICLGALFLPFEGKNGSVGATLCTCVEMMNKNGDNWRLYELAQKKPQLISAAEIPNRYLSLISDSNQKAELIDWIEGVAIGSTVNHFLYFYGGVGTGKTRSSIFLILQYLQKTQGKSGFYIPVYKFLDLKRRTHSYSYAEKDLKVETEFSFNLYLDKIKNTDFLILDELGQEVLSPKERRLIFDIIDSRYGANKVTVLISNHCDIKELSLDGQLLSKFVGRRISSRLKSAKNVYFDGADFRLQEQTETITKEDIERFMVPAKILTHDEHEHQIMTWLTRNPAFEVVSTKKRKELTYLDAKGEETDKDRPEPAFYSDVWVEGDVLKIHGPICDHEDKKLYALLLKELANSHKDGNKGLTLKISLKELIRLSALAEGGDAVKRIKRQLNRLVRMSLEFRNEKGNRWYGPLLTEIQELGTSSDRKLQIHFSHFMITFYRLHAYATFDRTKSQSLKGDSSAFYLFYSSHSMKEMTVSLDRCKKLLAIDDNFNKYDSLKRVKKAVDNLIKSGVMHPEKTFIKGGKVHTCLA